MVETALVTSEGLESRFSPGPGPGCRSDKDLLRPRLQTERRCSLNSSLDSLRADVKPRRRQKVGHVFVVCPEARPQVTTVTHRLSDL